LNNINLTDVFKQMFIRVKIAEEVFHLVFHLFLKAIELVAVA